MPRPSAGFYAALIFTLSCVGVFPYPDQDPVGVSVRGAGIYTSTPAAPSVQSPTSPPPSPSRTEYLEVPDTPTAPLVQRAGRIGPPPIRWGTNGTTIPGRCTQWEPLLAELAPPGGWDVDLMSGFMHRESGCCPMVRTGDGWRTTQGGDRFDGDCNLSHVAVWHHRSDAGLLQINGINYDPDRCFNTCLSDWLGMDVTLAALGDPLVNIAAAARLCEFWVRAGSSCYRPWR